MVLCKKLVLIRVEISVKIIGEFIVFYTFQLAFQQISFVNYFDSRSGGANKFLVASGGMLFDNGD